MKTKLIILLALVLFINCKDENTEEDCSTVLCLEKGYSLVLTMEDTNENWILENGYSEGDIQILNAENEEVSFNYNAGRIWVPVLDGVNGMHTLKIEDIEIQFSYDYTEPDGSCCDFGDLKDVSIANYVFTVSDFEIEIFI